MNVKTLTKLYLHSAAHQAAGLRRLVGALRSCLDIKDDKSLTSDERKQLTAVVETGMLLLDLLKGKDLDEN